MADNNNSFSLQNMIEFIGNNFGIIFLVTIFLVVGFMGGSLWTENQLLKNGSGGAAQVAKGGGGQPTAEGENEAKAGAAETGLSQASLVATAEKIGLDAKKMVACLEENRYQEKVQNQFKNGQVTGVRGTPGSIVVVNGQAKEFIGGAVPLDQLKSIIDQHLENPDQAVTTKEGFNPEKFVAISKEDHVRGNSEASVMIVEYSDYECPFCARFHGSMKQALEEYGDQVAWVYRHYPLTQLHPNAVLAAQTAECAAELGGDDAFWQFSDALLSE